MNKRDFIKALNKELENLPLSRQIQVLEKIKDKWLVELIQAKKKKEGTWVEPEEKEQYFFCEKCQRYTLNTKCKTESAREVRVVNTYRDAAYGEGDLDGEVEYLVIYNVCPRCGHKQEKQKHYIKTRCEWLRRWGKEKGRIK